MADAPPAFAPGTKLGDGGRYEIRRRVGVGGMAEVYKAIDNRLSDRVVAIKTLSATVADHPFAAKMRQLFIQEAQALSRVSDENVVDVLDFGVTESGTPYMVMEFLHGIDLGVFLKSTKPVPIDEAVDVMLGVCAGVYACHMAGIIHRDLKPANIFLSRTLKGRQPKVLDFSVAKVPVPQSADDIDRTRTDLIVGTPSYMSPEQALGRPANELSDQYSIGALLYRCLTRRPPHGVLPKPREMRPEIAPELEDVILRALDPTPAKRFATVHELGQRLLPFSSSAGRGRWKTYYHSAPRPFEPNTTGSISREIAAGLSGSEGATVVAEPYDFHVHERTTRIAVHDARADAVEATESTIVDPTPHRHTPSAASAAPPTVDVVMSPALGSGALSSTDIAPLQPAVTEKSAERADPPRDGTRAKIAVGFAIAAALVVVITIGGAVRLRTHAAARPTPTPPVVLGAPASLSAGLAPRASTINLPASPAPSAPSTSRSGSEPSSTVAIPSEARAPTRHARHHRPHTVGPDTIEYGGDGLPILH
jgi:serine/threonine protein kinase